jgi:hypothetical protein
MNRWCRNVIPYFIFVLYAVFENHVAQYPGHTMTVDIESKAKELAAVQLMTEFDHSHRTLKGNYFVASTSNGTIVE